MDPSVLVLGELERAERVCGPAPQSTVRKASGTSSHPKGAVGPSLSPTHGGGETWGQLPVLRQEWGVVCPVAVTRAFRQKGQWLGNTP